MDPMGILIRLNFFLNRLEVAQWVYSILNFGGAVFDNLYMAWHPNGPHPLALKNSYPFDMWKSSEKVPGTLKLTVSLHLKMDGWNTIVSFWGPAYFQGRLLLVSGSVLFLDVCGDASFSPFSSVVWSSHEFDQCFIPLLCRTAVWNRTCH